MVLQYVAASFHLPSVSTANINTVQYTKPHKQYEIPTIPTVVISKVLLPQSNIMADLVHSHSSLLSDVSPVSNYTEAAATCSAAHQEIIFQADVFGRRL